MPMLAEAGDTFWEVAQDIKRALDPGDILARGRYIPPLSR
jgi:FAD/FMN-containing dehydrogenase